MVTQVYERGGGEGGAIFHFVQPTGFDTLTDFFTSYKIYCYELIYFSLVAKKIK